MTTTSPAATGSQGRRALPMTGHTLGNRSAATCHFRCGDQCLTPSPSTSTAPHFADLAGRAVSRRSMLLGVGGAALIGGLAGQTASAPSAAAAPASTAGRSRAAAATTAGLGALGAFTPLPPTPRTVDDVVVPEGFRWHSVISWGDPVERDAPAFDLDRQTPEAQAQQFGYNCDYLTVLPLDGSGRKALLVANNEYTNENLMFPGYTGDGSLTDDQLRIAMAAHGMSVVQVRRSGTQDPWKPASSRYGRRVTASTTRFELTGPAAGHPLLQTQADPGGRTVLGTFANCAGGTTPWGTVLSGEENFQGYFARSDRMDARNSAYGISSSGRGWQRVDARFDTAQEPNEVNRFGWVVEVNPFDPRSTPRKHTAMGRFKHEGATPSVAPDGRVVAYMGDDEGGQHLYKFVSRDRVGRRARRGRENSIFEAGDLFVARFAVEGPPSEDYDGTGEWLPLTLGGRSVVPGMSLEEVLVFTRQAAAAVGATPMDRPEDVERDPVSGRVYMACTNNTGRTEPGPANPRATNRNGHVVELVEAGGDQTATAFTWSLVLVCGDPEEASTYFAGYPKEDVAPISCPDNVAFDANGGLWIATDGQPGTIGYADALHYVPVTGPERGHVQTFLTVPVEAETCGPLVDTVDGYVMVCVQHPGETVDAVVDRPASAFPYDGGTRTPRPGVVQVLRA